MAGHGGHICLVALIMVVAEAQGQLVNSQCSLNETWKGTWVSKFDPMVMDKVYYNYFNDSNRFDNLEDDGTLGQIDVTTGTASLCEISKTFISYAYNYYDDYDYDYTVEYQNTIMAYKVVSTQPLRYCFEGIARDDVLIYRATDPVTSTNGLAIDDCSGLLGAPTSWATMVKFQLDSSTGKLQFLNPRQPIPNMDVYLTYKDGTSDVEHCLGDKSSIVTITETQNEIKSCDSTNTYERPLQSTVWVVGVVTNEELEIVDSESIFGGMVVLAYPDDTSPVGFYFLIGSYSVAIDNRRLATHFVTNDKFDPRAFTRPIFVDNAVRQSSNYLTFYYYSRECEAEPCENGGNCTQLWRDYFCECPLGYAGQNCTEDQKECFFEIAPCNGHGNCTDGIGTYTCQCDPGWGGEFCDVLDYCNPDNCQHNGQCVGSLEQQDYYCICVDPYFGKDCELKDYCADPNACENGGTCHLAITGDNYICRCPMGFFGQFCESTVAPTVPTNATGMAACATDEDCLHDGVCVETFCECTFFYTGPLCSVLNPWVIASIALMCFMALLLIGLLIVCCCCCYGDDVGPAGPGYVDYNSIGSKLQEPSSANVQVMVAPIVQPTAAATTTNSNVLTS